MIGSIDLASRAEAGDFEGAASVHEVAVDERSNTRLDVAKSSCLPRPTQSLRALLVDEGGLLLLILASCSGDENSSPQTAGPGVCEPGKEEGCTCATGASGSQTCRENGSGWDPCVCLDASAGGSGGGDASTGDANQEDSGPLEDAAEDSTTDVETTDDGNTDAATCEPCVSSTPTEEDESSSTGSSIVYCPGGADPAATPPTCMLELNLPVSILESAQVDGSVEQTITGTLHVRMEELPLTGTWLFIPFEGTATLFGEVSFEGVVSAPSTEPLVWGCTAVDVLSFDIDNVELLDSIEIVGGDGGIVDPTGQLKMNVSVYLKAAILTAAVANLSNPSCSGQ